MVVLWRGPATLRVRTPYRSIQLRQTAMTSGVSSGCTTRQVAGCQCQSLGERGATCQRPSRHDERGVGIAHVEARALGVVTPGGFGQWIAVVYDTVFSHSALGTPPAGWPATGQRGIERRPVGARPAPRK